jgi:hypothetical protein
LKPLSTTIRSLNLYTFALWNKSRMCFGLVQFEMKIFVFWKILGMFFLSPILCLFVRWVSLGRLSLAKPNALKPDYLTCSNF